MPWPHTLAYQGVCAGQFDKVLKTNILCTERQGTWRVVDLTRSSGVEAGVDDASDSRQRIADWQIGEKRQCMWLLRRDTVL